MATSARKRTSPASKRASTARKGASTSRKGATSSAKRTSAKGTARKTAAKGGAATRGRKGASASDARNTGARKGSRKAAGARKGASSRRPNAVRLLDEDHVRVIEMFDRYERARSDEQKQSLASKICEELTLHAEVEEQVFYPAVREAIDDDDLMDEAEVEHATAKDLIAQIESGKVGDPQFDAKVKVLGEYIKHHVKEERNEMFAKARKSGVDLVALGEAITAFKAGTPAPQGGDSGGGSEDKKEKEGGLMDAVRSILPGSESR